MNKTNVKYELETKKVLQEGAKNLRLAYKG